MSGDTRNASARPPGPQEAYLTALRRYVDAPDEGALHAAYQLGRAALAEGSGLLDLSRRHHAALEAVLLEASAREVRGATLAAAAAFFTECISPFEMAYRGYHDAVIALRHFNDVLEQEAKRIAHSLHAEAGQMLVAVYLALQEIHREATPPVRTRVSDAIALLDEIEAQLRRLSHELRPVILDDLGVVPALRYLADGLSRRAGIGISVDGPADRWPRPVESALYRIAQEALTNVSRHARATHVWIRFRRTAHAIQCSIRDDGIGFDVGAVAGLGGERGFGLIGIRERVSVLGGTLHIASGAHQGTELIITIPSEGG